MQSSPPQALVSALYIYPIKSAAGIALDRATIAERGLAWDRRWMLVDERGAFLTQRAYPRMALLQVALHTDHLQVTAPGMEPLEVPFDLDHLPHQNVNVWRDHCDAIVLPAKPIGQWFSRFLGKDCQLVFMPDSSKRLVDPHYAHDAEIVSFADGFPMLLTTEASLADLNSRLSQAVTMQRFRPNIVLAGTDAFAEDGWQSIQVGTNHFQVVKPCSRCVMINVDPQHGTPGREPLLTLAKYRRVDGKILFGQNLLVENTGGVIQLGDTVNVLKLRPGNSPTTP